MEGTITIPGAGPVKKQYVYLGAAGVAGFLGYAYYRRNQAASDAPPSWGDVDPGAMVPDGDYVNPGGNSNIPPQDLTGQEIKTNAQWSQAATTLLGNIGYDPKTVASALGVFFQREGLDATQMDAVKAAVGQLGPPPENGPWPIRAKDAVTNPPTPNPDPVERGRSITATGTDDLTTIVTREYGLTGHLQTTIDYYKLAVSNANRGRSGGVPWNGAVPSGELYLPYV